LDALKRGDIDISFVRQIGDFGNTYQETVHKEPFVLAIPETHRFAKQESISLKDCAEEKFITYVPASAPDFHAMIMRMCAAAGYVPNITSEVRQVYTALGLVSSGAGIAFVPTAVQKTHFDKVIYRPIRGKQPKIELVLAWTQKNRSPLLNAFLETAKDVLVRWS
jgi:DNA-binding transcriptional LysR family regulator